MVGSGYRWDLPQLAEVLGQAIDSASGARPVDPADATSRAMAVDKTALKVLLAAARAVLDAMRPPELTPAQAKFKALLEELQSGGVRPSRETTSSWD